MHTPTSAAKAVFTRVLSAQPVRVGAYECVITNRCVRVNVRGHTCRVIKQMLSEILPSCVTFLDKDDLEDGAGGEYVDASVVVLVFCTNKYFKSRPCARELLRAVLNGKPLIALLEPEAQYGAMSLSEVRGILTDDWVAKWKLDSELGELAKSRGFGGISTGFGKKIATALCPLTALPQKPVIEWNRLPAFQNVTMRLIAERILRESVSTHDMAGSARSTSRRFVSKVVAVASRGIFNQDGELAVMLVTCGNSPTHSYPIIVCGPLVPRACFVVVASCGECATRETCRPFYRHGLLTTDCFTTCNV